MESLSEKRPTAGLQLQCFQLNLNVATAKKGKPKWELPPFDEGTCAASPPHQAEGAAKWGAAQPAWVLSRGDMGMRALTEAGQRQHGGDSSVLLCCKRTQVMRGDPAQCPRALMRGDA